MAGQTPPPAPQLPRRLPSPRQAFRLGAPGDIWHKPALSAVVTLAVLNFTLLGLGRLDLALYTSAGGMTALYGHGLPYRARRRTLGAVAAGTLASTGLALTASALTSSTAVLVAVCALLAAAHRTVCDAARIGPPGSIIITFTSASCAFVPQRPGDLPLHLALTAAGAALAWLVGMAPALLRPHGPERIAVARALEAAARLLHSDPQQRPRARTALVGAVDAARHTLALAAPTGGRPGSGPGLAELLIRGESALAAPATAGTGQAERYQGWARELRRGRPLPDVGPLSPAEAAELRGAGDRPVRQRGGIRQALRRGSALPPIGLRVALGCAAAGWLSMGFGVGRPYWAVVTAASVFQANSALSWQRALQRVLGNVLGLVLFTALLPVSRAGLLALVLLGLLCQFGAEATIARNYWLAGIFVTPMALLMTEFAGYHPVGQMVAYRWLDTCIGALAGLAACLLVTNRRTATRLERALAAVGDSASAVEPAAGGGPAGRRRLAHDLVELREAADTAAGEWWQRALPHGRVAHVEHEGHLLLAALVEQRGAEGSRRPEGVPAAL